MGVGVFVGVDVGVHVRDTLSPSLQHNMQHVEPAQVYLSYWFSLLETGPEEDTCLDERA